MTYPQQFAARGTKGSALAADGRSHVSGKPCPDDHYFLSADGHLWCPMNDWDQAVVRRILEAAFPYTWSKNPSSGV